MDKIDNTSNANSSIETERTKLNAELEWLKVALQKIENIEQMETFGISFIQFIRNYKAFTGEYSRIDISVDVEAYQDRFDSMVTYIKKEDATLDRLKDRILNTDLSICASNIQSTWLSVNALYEEFVDLFLRETLSKYPQSHN